MKSDSEKSGETERREWWQVPRGTQFGPILAFSDLY